MPRTQMLSVPMNWWRRHIGREHYLVVFLVLLRFIVVPYGQVVVHTDTGGYVWEARKLWNSAGEEEFDQGIQGTRPLGYPIFLRLCGASDESNHAALLRTTLIQLIVSGLAFGVLMVVVMRRFSSSPWRKWSAGAVVALLSLTVYAGFWDIVILTESLSVATFMLALALALTVFGRPSPANLAALALALIVLVSLRDANLIVPLCLLPSVLWHFRGRWNMQRWFAAIACLLFLVGLAFSSYRSAFKYRRGDVPLTNSLSVHAFQPHPELFDVFVRDYGLPPEVRPLVGKFFWSGWAQNPLYMDWIATFSARQYVGFLLSHPSFLFERLNAAFRDRSTELRLSASLGTYFDNVPPPLLEGSAPLSEFRLSVSRALSSIMTFPFAALDSVGGDYGHYLVFAVWIGLLVRMGYVSVRSSDSSIALLLLFVFVFVVSQTIMISLFEALEDHRHAVLADGLILLTFWLGVIGLGKDARPSIPPAEPNPTEVAGGSMALQPPNQG